ncbi:hypothetical protein ACLK11_00475 [Escherichia coli]
MVVMTALQRGVVGKTGDLDTIPYRIGATPSKPLGTLQRINLGYSRSR